MNIITAGAIAPDFTLTATGGQQISLRQYRGNRVVLYFYSKDNTPGCTDEAHEFRKKYQEITAMGAVILGVSRDNIAVHEKFREKHQLPFLLLSDADGSVCELYNVWKEKNMYGKKLMGIERSTFIINSMGIVTHVFRKVKVRGHAAEVLAALQNTEAGA